MICGRVVRKLSAATPLPAEQVVSSVGAVPSRSPAVTSRSRWPDIVGAVTHPDDDTTKVGRFLRGLTRIEAGLALQHSRILSYNENIPVQYEGTDHELKVHTDPEIDLDYYSMELGRLVALAEEIDRRFGASVEVRQAREAFFAVVPHVKATRNAIVHFDARPRLDDVVWLGGAIRRLYPDGRVEHLVDARYEHHEAALALAAALGRWLRGRLREALAADPAAPLDEQIRSRAAASSPGSP